MLIENFHNLRHKILFGNMLDRNPYYKWIYVCFSCFAAFDNLTALFDSPETELTNLIWLFSNRNKRFGKHNSHNSVVYPHGNFVVDRHIKMNVKHRLEAELDRSQTFTSGCFFIFHKQPSPSVDFASLRLFWLNCKYLCKKFVETIRRRTYTNRDY